MMLQGIGASPGIVIGRAHLLASPDHAVRKLRVPEHQAEREVERLKAALARTKD